MTEPSPSAEAILKSDNTTIQMFRKLLTEGTDARGNATTYSYAPTYADNACSVTGNSPGPTTIQDAAGHSTTLVYYTCNGKVQSSTDPNNAQTTFTYDLAGNLTNTVMPTGGGSLGRDHHSYAIPWQLTTTQTATRRSSKPSHTDLPPNSARWLIRIYPVVGAMGNVWSAVRLQAKSL